MCTPAWRRPCCSWCSSRGRRGWPGRWESSSRPCRTRPRCRSRRGWWRWGGWRGQCSLLQSKVEAKECSSKYQLELENGFYEKPSSGINSREFLISIKVRNWIAESKNFMFWCHGMSGFIWKIFIWRFYWDFCKSIGKMPWQKAISETGTVFTHFWFAWLLFPAWMWEVWAVCGVVRVLSCRTEAPAHFLQNVESKDQRVQWGPWGQQ